jgi:hypothetical protein
MSSYLIIINQVDYSYIFQKKFKLQALPFKKYIKDIGVLYHGPLLLYTTSKSHDLQKLF